MLGTDGYGRSDTRAALRRFFEVDRAHIALAALEGLAEAGSVARESPGVRRSRSSGSIPKRPTRRRRRRPMIEVRVPDIGDFDQVDVVEVLVEPGKRVEADESLITLESEKASMDVPSPSAGVVKEIAVKVGDKVGEGDLIVKIEAEGEGEAKEEPPGEGGDEAREGSAEAGREEAESSDRAKRKPAKEEAEPAKEEAKPALGCADRARQRRGNGPAGGRRRAAEAVAHCAATRIDGAAGRVRAGGARQPVGAPVRARSRRRRQPGPRDPDPRAASCARTCRRS